MSFMIIDNYAYMLIYLNIISIERKQTALIADDKLHTQISRRIFATESLRNEVYYEH